MSWGRDSRPTCKGCDAEIRWAKVDGRWKPFEASPSKRGTHALVPNAINHREHDAIWIDPTNPRYHGRDRHQLHQEVCPAASQFRRGV